jgi:hypothetical protein
MPRALQQVSSNAANAPKHRLHFGISSAFAAAILGGFRAHLTPSGPNVPRLGNVTRPGKRTISMAEDASPPESKIRMPKANIWICCTEIRQTG